MTESRDDPPLIEDPDRTKSLDSRIVENSPDHIAIVGLDYRYQRVNGAYEKAHGLSRHDIVGSHVADLLGRETFEKTVKPMLDACLAGEEAHYEAWFEFQDRERRFMSVTYSPLLNANGATAGILVTSRDLTERRQAEEASRDSVRQLRLITDAMPALIVYIDSAQRFLFVNQTAERWYGRPNAEIIGRTTTEVLGHPMVPMANVRMTAALGGTPQFFEDSYPYPDGHQRFVSGSYIPHRSEDGEVLGIYGLVIDITERRQLEEQIRRTQKMDAVGQLTGGIAHDFNNILAIILGNLELLQDLAEDSPDIQSYAETALKGVRRGADITRKLLGFSHQGPSHTRLTAVNGFITDMKDLIARSLTVSIDVESHLAADPWPVRIDPGDLEDAILNLSLNARDAMPDGGILAIETANKVLDDDYVRRNPTAKAGEFVMIAVSDTGTGMTAEVKEKLFEPFFTTKEFSEGSGLGLSMVFGFVERSGGHIKVYSEPGAGTTFRIYLPRALEEAKDAELEPGRQADLPGGSETILIVDDEEILLDVAAAYLEKLGYQTLTAGHGKQALDILEGRRNIDLLFCDVIMPGGLDGYQVALAARETRPALRVLLTSGFAKKREEYANGEDGYLAGLAGSLLSKPYNHEELASAVRKTLDDAVSGTIADTGQA